jgi:hypothetical protein
MSDTNVAEAPATETPVEQKTTITAGVNPLIDFQKAAFRFKKDKLGNIRPKVELENFPVPSIAGIIAIIEKGGKELDLLRESIYDTVRGVVADWVGSAEENNEKTFDPNAFTWEKIANMPKEDRRSVSIDPETWKAFAEDYIEVMPGVTNKTKENVANAVEVYLKKFSIVKTNKPVLKKLQEQLGLYMEHSKKAEEFQEILDMLQRRIETYLAQDDVQALIANL